MLYNSKEQSRRPSWFRISLILIDVVCDWVPHWAESAQEEFRSDTRERQGGNLSFSPASDTQFVCFYKWGEESLPLFLEGGRVEERKWQNNEWEASFQIKFPMAISVHTLSTYRNRCQTHLCSSFMYIVKPDWWPAIGPMQKRFPDRQKVLAKVLYNS